MNAKSRRVWLGGALALVALVGISTAMNGCSKSESAPPMASGPAPTPGGESGTKIITGAGATFPYPIYSKWNDAYNKQTGVKMNYQSIGSGGGIAQITAKTVDFGASDKPLTPEELDKVGLMQFPTVMGGVVLVVNLPGRDA